ncbi:GNAT family N-acetyltransferase [Xenorhabdus thuongxuanensis]|uniref:Acetyltransferase n=2 Tax=Xenorhabdus thuongxuanensis TaxID=1873484 RepID=A0A1Q5TU19_9GAMM|nr:GNAT family N-acetyltransferase [Xenorhabdus thuongxuanensis]OKP03721.1 acetyltransferase [Xenorhabdus thuongxuanensis]
MNSSEKKTIFINKLNDFTVKKATRQDWECVVQWGNKEGWNIGYHDADCMYSVDNDGLFIGWIGDQAVAAVSLINHSKQYAIWGNYLVDNDFRGKGYGKAVCKVARSHAGNRDIGSNAMPYMVSNYKKSGLNPIYNIIHYTGKLKKIESENIKEISIIKPHNIDSIIKYDSLFFPTLRQKFLNSWLFSSGHISYLKMVNGDIFGYGVIRPLPDGFRIGPLVARTPSDAEELFNTLTSSLPENTKISIFLPEYVHESFFSFLRKRGIFEQFHVVYMHKGNFKMNIPNNMYCIANLDLG